MKRWTLGNLRVLPFKIQFIQLNYILAPSDLGGAGRRTDECDYVPSASIRKTGAGVNGNTTFAKFEGQNLSVANLALLPTTV